MKKTSVMPSRGGRPGRGRGASRGEPWTAIARRAVIGDLGPHEEAHEQRASLDTMHRFDMGGDDPEDDVAAPSETHRPEERRAPRPAREVARYIPPLPIDPVSLRVASYIVSGPKKTLGTAEGLRFLNIEGDWPTRTASPPRGKAEDGAARGSCRRDEPPWGTRPAPQPLRPASRSSRPARGLGEERTEPLGGGPSRPNRARRPTEKEPKPGPGRKPEPPRHRGPRGVPHPPEGDPLDREVFDPDTPEGRAWAKVQSLKSWSNPQPHYRHAWDPKRCWRCGATEHSYRQCTRATAPPFCTACGRKGVNKNTCGCHWAAEGWGQGRARK